MSVERFISIQRNQTKELGNGTKVFLKGISGTLSHWINERAGEHLAFRFNIPAEDDLSDEFRAALYETGIFEQETLHLDVPPTFRMAEPGLTDDTVVLEPARPDPSAAQVVLYQDESGALSWHFPDGFKPGQYSPAPIMRGAGRKFTFTIPARTTAAQTAVQSDVEGVPSFRGPITKVGRKVFKILLIPVLDAVTSAPIQWLGSKIESRYRQELIRSLTPDNYQKRVATPFADWSQLADKRSLLLIHGIFSSTEGVLSRMPRYMVEELNAKYQGRMISFDQITVSRSPEENAINFLKSLPTNKKFEFDILCHSRGGIVARALAEKGAGLTPEANCTFPRVFFAATPNAGSVLADPAHMVDMVDVFTNLVTSFPDGATAYSIEVILGIIKVLVSSSEHNLPGLAAMGTQSYINKLNEATTPVQSSYAAATSDYSPDPTANNSFLTGQIGNAVINRVFKDNIGLVANDLVVPSEGVFGANGHPSFPIGTTLKYGPKDHVWHNDFFSRQRTFDAIKIHFDMVGNNRVIEIHEENQFTYRVIVPKKKGVTHRLPSFKKSLSVEKSAEGGGDDFELPSFRAGAPASEVAKMPREIRRTPGMDFHEKVEAGVEWPLVVRLSEIIPNAPSSDLAFPLATGESETKVMVLLRAPGFDIIGPDHLPMVLKMVREPQSEKVTFRVKGREPAPLPWDPEGPVRPQEHEICAEFWHRNVCVGACWHKTVVLPNNFGDAPGAGQTRCTELVIDDGKRRTCDWIIVVTGVNNINEPPFRMQIISDVSGCLYAGNTLGTFSFDTKQQSFANYLSQIYSPFVRRINELRTKQDYTAWTAEFQATLAGLGGLLWDGLPQEFRDLYLDCEQRGIKIGSILISSTEMEVPWELIRPVKKNGDILAPLGQRHVLGRWKSGLRLKPDPQKLKVKSFCVVNPDYTGSRYSPLPEAQREANDLCQLFKGAKRVTPADFLTVQADVLNATGVHMLHFSGHGEFSAANPDLSNLILHGGSTLSALMLSGANFANSTPFVYLNACQVGSNAAAIGRPGGFSSILLDRSCAGVIAPYWPVEDGRAREFASKLYEQLLNGRPIGEALQNLRAAYPENITYQSFAFVGDPLARLDFSGVLTTPSQGQVSS